MHCGITFQDMKKVINKTTSDGKSNQSNQSPVVPIWFRLPYCGDKSVQLANSCVKKIKRYCKKDINIKSKFLYDTTKLEFFCGNKDKTPFFNNSYVVYHFNCPGCCASYVGKTQRTLHERCIKHTLSDKDSAVRAYINECDGIKHIKNLKFLNTFLDGDVTTLDHRDININIVNNNVLIIDSHRNCNFLLYKEAIEIKELKPLLNDGLKV